MKHSIAYACLIGFVTCVILTIATAQVVPREPRVNAEGRITDPFTGTAAEVEDQPGLIRVYLDGSGDANSRVQANLTIKKAGKMVLSVPLESEKRDRIKPSSGKDWSIEIRLTRELAEDAEISLYLSQSDAPYDTGKAFKIRVARLLPAATTRPVQK